MEKYGILKWKCVGTLTSALPLTMGIVCRFYLCSLILIFIPFKFHIKKSFNPKS